VVRNSSSPPARRSRRAAGFGESASEKRLGPDAVALAAPSVVQAGLRPEASGRTREIAIVSLAVRMCL
jgi:hypothetical protein